MAVTTADGLRVSLDRGRRWTAPTGLLPRGSFYTVIVDTRRPGVAYLANGDVYATRDGSETWRRLASPTANLGPAGITVLAMGSQQDVLYAGGRGVVAYRPDSGWQTWGRLWPRNDRASALLSVPGRGLFAASGNRLLFASGASASWRLVSLPFIEEGGTITALGMGPDGATPDVALRNNGIWSINRRGVAEPVPGFGLPDDAVVSALVADSVGGDLYAAVDRGLYMNHKSTAGNPGSIERRSWLPAIDTAGDPIVTLRQAGDGMFAVTKGGVIYQGGRGRGQSLIWKRLQSTATPDGSPVVSLSMGSEWQNVPVPPPLPARFTQNCLRFGPTPDRAFDVCGPFADTYLRFRYPVFGWPLQRPNVAGDGSIRQTFDNVILEWTPRAGVYLAPLGRVKAGRRSFARPSAAEALRAGTAYVNGYYVDPIFYPYWRHYLMRGASVFGPPISQAQREQSSNGTGRQVMVQYFVNARLEYHPELATGSVQLSDLGATFQGQYIASP